MHDWRKVLFFILFFICGVLRGESSPIMDGSKRAVDRSRKPISEKGVTTDQMQTGSNCNGAGIAGRRDTKQLRERIRVGKNQKDLVRSDDDTLSQGSSLMQIKSPKFAQGGKIPSVYTCEGNEWNPPLEFSGVPKEAKSLVLIMEDPDVSTSIRPDGLWVHWIIYEMKPDTKEVREHSTPPGTYGRGTSDRTAYEGPCPPDREHRYFFRLYALDFMPDWPKGMTKEEVMKEMGSHIIAEAELMGTYQTQKVKK